MKATTHSEADAEALERRVRRLEDAVAALQDTSLLETRVVERLLSQVEASRRAMLSSTPMLGAERILPPSTITIETTAATVPEHPNNGSVLALPPGPTSAATDRPSSVAEILLPPMDAPLKPTGSSDSTTSATPSAGIVSHQVSWLLMEIVKDLRNFFLMYVDANYRVTRTTQLLVPILLALILCNYLFPPPVPLPLVGTILQKIIDILLAVVLYKQLYRESIRYRLMRPRPRSAEGSGLPRQGKTA